MDYNQFDTETLRDMRHIAYCNRSHMSDSRFRVNALDGTYDRNFDIPDSFANREHKQYQTKYNEINSVLLRRR